VYVELTLAQHSAVSVASVFQAATFSYLQDSEIQTFCLNHSIEKGNVPRTAFQIHSFIVLSPLFVNAL